MSGIMVSGIVAKRDNQPYIQLLNEHGIIGQFTMAEARSFAADIQQVCARTEADAMIHRFFDSQDYPAGAGQAIMLLFREFRHELDMEKVERSETDPDTGEEL